jgi:hypothetical protein
VSVDQVPMRRNATLAERCLHAIQYTGIALRRNCACVAPWCMLYVGDPCDVLVSERCSTRNAEECRGDDRHTQLAALQEPCIHEIKSSLRTTIKDAGVSSKDWNDVLPLEYQRNCIVR